MPHNDPVRLETVSNPTTPQNFLLPERPHDGHKGTFGRVLIIGGSAGMIGAPVFAGTSALKMGAGLVEIAVPNTILTAALSITPELIGVDSGAIRELKSACAKADAIVIGPGLGRSNVAEKMVRNVITLRKKLVIDADALAVLAKFEAWPRGANAEAVLTPHPGEMATLMHRTQIPFDSSSRRKVAIDCARKFGQVVVLKGHETVVTDGKRIFINKTGDTSLAKAGTGDLLSGMIGSLLGQNMNCFEAACLGVHLHGRAGEIAGGKLGPRSVMARDVIDAISEAIRRHVRKR